MRKKGVYVKMKVRGKYSPLPEMTLQHLTIDFGANKWLQNSWRLFLSSWI